MIGIEFIALGALFLVADAIAYTRYREVQDKYEHRSHTARTAHIRGVLHEEVVKPVRDISPEELTAIAEAEHAPIEPEFDEVEFLESNAPLEPKAEEEFMASPTEGEMVFMPPMQAGSAPAFPSIAFSREEPEENVEARLRDFEKFQQKNEAELSLLRYSLESLNRKLKESPVVAKAKPLSNTARKLTIRQLKAQRNKLNRELGVLQRRFMKRQVDAETFQRLTAELQMELNKVHAAAMELAEQHRPK